MATPLLLTKLYCLIFPTLLFLQFHAAAQTLALIPQKIILLLLIIIWKKYQGKNCHRKQKSIQFLKQCLHHLHKHLPLPKQYRQYEFLYADQPGALLKVLLYLNSTIHSFYCAIENTQCTIAIILKYLSLNLPIELSKIFLCRSLLLVANSSLVSIRAV